MEISNSVDRGGERMFSPATGNQLEFSAAAAAESIFDRLPDSYCPYRAYFKREEWLREQRRRRAPLWLWAVWERVKNSLFFLGFRYLFLLYAVELALILCTHFGVVPNDLVPDSSLIITLVGTMHTFLLSQTAGIVTQNSKQLLSSFATELKKALQTYVVMLSGTLVRPGDSANSETARRLIIQQRHILAAYTYNIVNFASPDYTIDTSMLTAQLRDELEHSMRAKSNEAYSSRLVGMLNARTNALFAVEALSTRAASATLKQREELLSVANQVDFASENLNYPIVMVDALLVITWVMLIYYSYALYVGFGLVSSLLIVWIPNLFFHGLSWYSKLYNNPFALAVKNRIPGVELLRMTHEAVLELDQEINHVLSYTGAAVTTTTATQQKLQMRLVPERPSY